MGRVTGAVRRWVSRPARDEGADAPASNFIYRLKTWPDLADEARTADVFRILSVMSSRPVNRNWLLTTSRMHPAHVDQFLRELTEAGAVEVIDPSGFAPLA